MPGPTSLRRLRLRATAGALIALGLMLAAAVAVPAGAVAAPKVITASSGPLTATLTPSTHTPKIGVPMSITVTATLHGRPARATALYQYVFGGAVVATRHPYNKKNYTFTGRYSDTLSFPAQSLGAPLTLRVVVTAAGRTVRLNCAIVSRR